MLPQPSRDPYESKTRHDRDASNSKPSRDPNDWPSKPENHPLYDDPLTKGLHGRVASNRKAPDPLQKGL